MNFKVFQIINNKMTPKQKSSNSKKLPWQLYPFVITIVAAFIFSGFICILYLPEITYISSNCTVLNSSVIYYPCGKRHNNLCPENMAELNVTTQYKVTFVTLITTDNLLSVGSVYQCCSSWINSAVSLYFCDHIPFYIMITISSIVIFFSAISLLIYYYIQSLVNRRQVLDKNTNISPTIRSSMVPN